MAAASFFLAWTALFGGAILAFGAPVMPVWKTAAAAGILTALTWLPTLLAFPAKAGQARAGTGTVRSLWHPPVDWERVEAAMLFWRCKTRAEVVAVWQVHCTVAGLVAGAAAMALDWQQWWQAWPLSVVAGSMAGFAAGSVAGLLAPAA